ncbi:MAG: hypothetical protein GX442_12490 [Candidatus Riflebacteria bacterium]|nr:hypothetical protein [Candidatus Riflebacteria bacterium]
MTDLLRKLTLLAFLLVALLVGLIVRDHFSIPSRHLTIFYTSNLRGQINPFPAQLQDRQLEKAGGMAFIRGLIDDTIRRFQLDPEYVLLLDTGDALFGSAEASLTLGEVPLDLMTKMGYAAMAVGNMEFELGFDTLRSLAQNQRVPMLACNYRDLKAPLGNTFLPSLMIRKGSHQIGLIGLGHAELARNTRQENILQVEVTDLRTSVQRAAAQLKLQGAELVILLSHHPALDTRTDLAESFPDVDIVIGDMIGPHYPTPPTRPVLCQTAPARGAGIGMVKIPYIGNAWQPVRAFHSILTVDATQVPPSPALIEEIARVETKVESLLEEVVARSVGDFRRTYEGESTMGNLVADAMRVAAQSEIAFQNSGGIKSSFASGSISLRDLYDALPFENSIVKMKLQGWQIENLVEESLSERGTFLQTSGLRCTYSGKNPPGFRLVQISVGDDPLEFDRWYWVAVNDFMLSTPVSWPELAQGKERVVVGLLRESLKNHLEEQQTVRPSPEPRFIDIGDRDETLRFQALSFEMASLSTPLVNDGTPGSPLGRLIADVLRTETDSDFSLLPLSLLKVVGDPLEVLTPGRLIADLPDYLPVETVDLPGATVQRLLEASLASGGQPLCFSGFSAELHDGRLGKIFPWEGDFDPARVYKVAVPGSFGERVAAPAGVTLPKGVPWFTDLRRVLINGIRRRGGKVELKQALF